jgi:hypothetical protein
MRLDMCVLCVLCVVVFKSIFRGVFVAQHLQGLSDEDASTL